MQESSKKLRKTLTQRVRDWRLRNPEKNHAQRIVFVNLRNGKLKKLPCFCGKIKVEGHHEDYSKPLDVKWLCRKHHNEADAKRRENENKTTSKPTISK